MPALAFSSSPRVGVAFAGAAGVAGAAFGLGNAAFACARAALASLSMSGTIVSLRHDITPSTYALESLISIKICSQTPLVIFGSAREFIGGVMGYAKRSCSA